MTNDTPSIPEFFKSTNSLIGGLVGVAITGLTVIAFGQDIIKAPQMALQAQSTAVSAQTLAEQVEEDLDTFRIAFCTKEGFLSPSGYASLRCWEVDRGANTPETSNQPRR